MGDLNNPSCVRAVTRNKFSSFAEFWVKKLSNLFSNFNDLKNVFVNLYILWVNNGNKNDVFSYFSAEQVFFQ